jgi:hypothetical protein
MLRSGPAALPVAAIPSPPVSGLRTHLEKEQRELQAQQAAAAAAAAAAEQQAAAARDLKARAEKELREQQAAKARDEAQLQVRACLCVMRGSWLGCMQAGGLTHDKAADSSGVTVLVCC